MRVRGIRMNRLAMFVAVVVFLSSFNELIDGFSIISRYDRIRHAPATQLSCICVDCARVTDCAAYHFVEDKHEQPHMSEDPTFSPREGSPTIHVNIRTIRTPEERQTEVERMWKEYKAEEERAWASDDRQLHGERVYDMSPQVTYEYDVVSCEDFVEDKGCWVRNMPEEIRLANPDFVPS